LQGWKIRGNRNKEGESIEEIEKPAEVIPIALNVYLDRTDYNILQVFRRYPDKAFYAHQLRTILGYSGLDINYGELRDRLKVLVVVGVLKREKGRKFFRYGLEFRSHDAGGL
jgi:hypothetical protein